MKDSEPDFYDKNDMKEKVNDLVRLHEAMQEKLKTASYSSPGLLLIAESISVDISGKPTVVFFLKITSPSWIISSISLDELNLIDWLLRSWWLIFSK